nr:hypothetical protein [Acetobacter syzygii]
MSFNLQEYELLIINSPIESGLFLEVLKECTDKKKKNKVIVSITTYGGIPNEAYQVGRYLQNTYDDVVAYIPSQCKSAGTLLAAAASKIFFTPFGELGPLDVQVRKKDEILGRRSGLNTVAAIENLKIHTFDMFEHFMWEITALSRGAISFKTAAEISAKTASDIMSNIYKQVDIESLGQDCRDLSVATQYCKRLAAFFGNIKEKGINKLVKGYPSHDFVIDPREASTIFEHSSMSPHELFTFSMQHGDKIIRPRDSKDTIIEIIHTESETENAECENEKSQDDTNSSPADSQGEHQSGDDQQG